ncbi:rhamnogalacturonan acetylesterase [Marinoscillum luteum]|uniref:Rhamnogalacturonan acetylesterase n=1 Tax=Marinoscillum luteum TaxID=861051 RepID=A0ABW7N2H8_9BACT
MRYLRKGTFVLAIFLLLGCAQEEERIVTIYLIGDSTMADYADNYEEGKDYYKTRYPVTGWGQVFQPYFSTDLSVFADLFSADSVVVDDRARGGRSTRTFFQEGRWRSVYESLKPGDLVIMQFGHNDAAEKKTERYVDIEGYKEFLRLFIAQSKQKGATPIVLTPVARNYPWENNRLQNVHGEYPDAALEVAREMSSLFIDLNQLSMNAFFKVGREYVTQNYFMNLDSGVYEAYPNGQRTTRIFNPRVRRWWPGWFLKR